MAHSLSAFNQREYGALCNWSDLNDGVFIASSLVRTYATFKSIALKFGPAQGPVEGFERQNNASKAVLLRTIAAGVALHASGAAARLEGGEPDIKDDSSDLVRLFNKIWDDPGGKLAAAFGLGKAEVAAVQAYTSPMKDEEVLSKEKMIGPLNNQKRNPHYNVSNPHYMFKKFGLFDSGWAALTSALNKIPDFRQLGLRLPTFRVVRDSSEILALSHLNPGDRVVLGARKMKTGQYHTASTSLTYSVHLTPLKVEAAGGLIVLSGVSGVFINWLGVMTMSVDGGEVLYRPGTVMQYVETIPCGYAGRYPIFVLSEVSKFNESDLRTHRHVDDFNFKDVGAEEIGAARNYASITDLLDLWD